jgi:3-hydroxybutyryl-CoA dehydratase
MRGISNAAGSSLQAVFEGPMAVAPGDIFTETFVISDQVQKHFIAAFEDRHPLHTDDRYARSMGFDSPVAHGNILCGFLSYFVGVRLPEPDVMIMSQSVRFRKPCYFGETITLFVKVDDVHDSVGLIDLNCKFLNTAGQILADAKMALKRLEQRQVEDERASA